MISARPVMDIYTHTQQSQMAEVNDTSKNVQIMINFMIVERMQCNVCCTYFGKLSNTEMCMHSIR